MQVLYFVFGLLCLIAGVYEMVTVSVVLGATSVAFGMIILSLSSMVDRIKALEGTLADMAQASRHAPNLVGAAKAAPTEGTPTHEPTADEIVAAKALLASAQNHHFAKRFAQARQVYQQIIDDYGATKQAATARQQLVNLRDA